MAITPTLSFASEMWPGVLICVVIALAASFVSEHHGGPQLLYALLIGLAFNFLNHVERVGSGVALCARTGLRCGVALLGARISVDQVTSLGWRTGVGVALAVVSTILFGMLLAKVMHRPREEGVISGCAVGICGASAALAVAAALPATKENERFTLLAVVGVTMLSTMAMVVYPLLLSVYQASPTTAGVFLGGTIHDIAQVVAAGLLMGPETGETATIVKLFRVALLVPIAAAIAFFYRQSTAGSMKSRVPSLPAFLLWFLFFVALTSTGVVGATTTNLAADTSRWLLLGAIGASGIKTNFAELMQLGWRPVVLLISETVFIAAFVFAWAM